MTVAPTPVPAGRPARRWAVASAVLAPVVLIGGWTVAAAAQPPGYSAVRQTISALAAHGAHDRYLMTGGLAALGLCHLVTAAGLQSARRRGRIALAVGGLATVAVALFPQPAGGSSNSHVAAAAVGFLALTAWPALAGRRGERSLLAVGPALAATAGLGALLIWFALTLTGDQVGVSERALAGAQAVWPLLVVLSTGSRRHPAR